MDKEKSTFDVVEEVKAEDNKGDTITVSEFIELYESDKTKEKMNVEKILKIVPYINYEVKIALAENIISHANINSETGEVMLNSPLRFLFYVFTVINKYTNVKMGASDMFGDFNALNSRGLIEFLMKKIPEKELNELTTVIDMVADDLIANKYEPHAYIRDLVHDFSSISVNYLSPILDTLTGILSNTDDEATEVADK